MTSAPHMLVVDDHRDSRDALAKYLEKYGMPAITTANAAAMDAAMKVGQFDLIVLDVMMQGEDGLSVCRISCSDRQAGSFWRCCCQRCRTV